MTEMDMTPRYVPDTMLVVGGKGYGSYPVLKSIIHPPGEHPPRCPIHKDMTVLECQTDAGSRWYGVERGWINSKLRMVIVGTNKRDEVRMKWEVCSEN